MFTAAKLSLAIAYGREAFARADGLRKEIGLIPEVVRNRARDTGTRKPRNVAVQEAVNKLVARHPALTAKELWQEAPSAITDKIEFDRFRKRVTDARRQGRKQLSTQPYNNVSSRRHRIASYRKRRQDARRVAKKWVATGGTRCSRKQHK